MKKRPRIDVSGRRSAFVENKHRKKKKNRGKRGVRG